MRNTTILLLATIMQSITLHAQENTATGKKRNGETYTPDGIELIYVEDTTSAAKSFYIGKFEITQAQWKNIMGGNPSNFKGDNLPVETVSWNDCQEFISKLNAATGKNYRLPSEAEWEYAAKGGSANKFCPDGCEYSGSNSVDNVAWHDGNSKKKTHPVGAKAPNELGIYDMSGNVYEWCQDLFTGSGANRVIRGGCFDYTAAYCRVTSRVNGAPANRRSFIGLRIVLPALQ